MRPGLALETALVLLALGSFVVGGVAQRASPPVWEPAPRPENGLRIVTWNVGGTGDGVGEALSEEHLAHVAECLTGLDPDLCFLQEVASPGQIGRLMLELGGGWRWVLSRGGDGSHVAALARRGELRAWRLRGVGGRFVAVDYRPTAGPALRAVGLHADAFSSRERNAFVGALLERLLTARGEGALVLAGDLNLDLDLDKRRDLLSDDAYLDVETYNVVADQLDDAAQGTGSTAVPDRRLDYVFVEREAFEVLSSGVWKGRREGTMDHDPVVVDVVPRR